MNVRDMQDMAALIDRLSDLVGQFVEETSPERIALLRAQITEATDRLKRMAASLQN